VEWWAGIGGQMAGERKKQAVRGKARAGGTFNKVKKLNEAALKIVDERAVEIAQSLFDGTRKGHVQSTRLLVELAEGNVEAEDALATRPVHSLALDLATEPRWPLEMLETDAKTGVGGREPEGT
jgi:hypothetical protein